MSLNIDSAIIGLSEAALCLIYHPLEAIVVSSCRVDHVGSSMLAELNVLAVESHHWVEKEVPNVFPYPVIQEDHHSLAQDFDFVQVVLLLAEHSDLAADWDCIRPDQIVD